MNHKPTVRNQAGTTGFSLVEVAVVLLIVSVLVSIVAIPMATQMEQQRTLDTQKQLESIKEALYGFAMANGRLPCPAISTSAGVESFCTNASGACGAVVTTYPSHGRCAAFASGAGTTAVADFVPAATLGLTPVDSSGFMIDAWGLSNNRIRYAVPTTSITSGTPTACTSTVSFPLTLSDGIKTATMSCITNSAVTFLGVVTTTVTNVAAGCSPTSLATQAPFVLFSVGKNAPTGGTGSDEARNITVGTTSFVSRVPTSSGHCAGEFDDIVTWGSLSTLFAKMVQAGKLP